MQLDLITGARLSDGVPIEARLARGEQAPFDVIEEGLFRRRSKALRKNNARTEPHTEQRLPVHETPVSQIARERRKRSIGQRKRLGATGFVAAMLLDGALLA